MPRVFFRSSSFRSYRNSPSTAESTKASEYWPSDSVCSHLATSSTLHAETLSTCWPDSWPGRRSGRKLAFEAEALPSWPSGPPEPKPTARGACTSASAAMTVSWAETVRSALIMLSEEK